MKHDQAGVPDPAGAPDPAGPPAAAIVTHGLSKTYGGISRLPLGKGQAVRALIDLDIGVREGEIFGFLGPNGAGKTTMIRILLGFLHASSGSARVLGHAVGVDALGIRQRVGYLPGGIAFYDSMTGIDLLDYLARLYGRGAPLRAELTQRLELSARDLRRPVRDYSRGMRQKLGIVQALQHDPELSILDEPTEGLDPLMQRAFYEVLDDLRRKGRTVFFSSHILPEVERVCDRVAIIRSGRLVALSDVDALLRRRRRHVELRVDGDYPALAGVAGVSDVRQRDGRVTCELEGEVAPFLAAIAGTRVTDLTIEPARLEEAFLEYYADEESSDATGSGVAGADVAAARSSDADVAVASSADTP